MTDNEKIVCALRVALERIETFIDPYDHACGVDGLARYEIRQGQYFQSWIIPRIKYALRVLEGGPVDPQNDHWNWEDYTHHDVKATMHRSPFSRFRDIATPECPKAPVYEDKHEFWPHADRCRNCGYRPGSFAEMARSAPLEIPG